MIFFPIILWLNVNSSPKSNKQGKRTYFILNVHLDKVWGSEGKFIAGGSYGCDGMDIRFQKCQRNEKQDKTDYFFSICFC